jgi:hypothetical protein
MRGRVAIVSDGIYVHCSSIGRIAYALYRRYPKAFTRQLELERILLGGANWHSAATHARVTGDLLRPSTCLADSPYVQLLEEYRTSGDSIFVLERFVTTAYCKHAFQCIEAYGRYFSASNIQGVLLKAKNFCRMLDGEPIIQTGTRDSGPQEPVEVRRIKFSDCYEIVDGHHRLALAFVRGLKRFPCAILPTEGALTPLQQMVMDPVWLAGKPKLSQPISARELRGWPVLRACSDRLQMILQYLSQMGISAGSVLDLYSNYGWFVSEMRRRGFRALGFEPNSALAGVGALAYDLDASRIMRSEIGEFLRSAQQQYDIVFCLSTLQEFVLGNQTISASEFIRLVDSITGKVLFIDTAESHEPQFGDALKNWNVQHIKRWLQDHTSFSVIEPLGTDKDFRHGTYGRHLFACVRD